MNKYICSVCGYVHDESTLSKWEDLPDDYKCPVCGATKAAFTQANESDNSKAEVITKPHFDKTLSAMEMSIICSNLQRGCEKQYMTEQSEGFKFLAEFFRSKDENPEKADTEKLLELINEDLSSAYVYANHVSGKKPDRGALRALVWSEKVSRMLKSLLEQYEKEGDRMLENTNVYVCTICGFVYVGDNPPELCPVCKVPDWKFEKIEGGVK